MIRAHWAYLQRWKIVSPRLNLRREWTLATYASTMGLAAREVKERFNNSID
jgi:hypothetical protein